MGNHICFLYITTKTVSVVESTPYCRLRTDVGNYVYFFPCVNVCLQKGDYSLRYLMSCSMRSPRRPSAAGLAIHANMLGGIQAGSTLMGQLAGSFRLNAKYRPLDSSSASSEPVLEHRVIFSIATVQPAAVATVLMAVTRVEQRLQRVL